MSHRKYRAHREGLDSKPVEPWVRLTRFPDGGSCGREPSFLRFGRGAFDISNPLDLSRGMPPSLFVSNTDSLGEQIQRAFPGVKVVKALNTVNAPRPVSSRAGAEADSGDFKS
jgi:hypothetical protein